MTAYHIDSNGYMSKNRVITKPLKTATNFSPAFLSSDKLYAGQERKSSKKEKKVPSLTDYSPQTSKRDEPMEGSHQMEEAVKTMLKSLDSPTFIKRRNTFSAYERLVEEAKKNPRKKWARSLMRGYETCYTKPFYDQMGFKSLEERRVYVNRTSKNRAFDTPPSTPPRYWDLDVPSKEEQVKLGYVIETESPLFKRKRNKPITVCKRATASQPSVHFDSSNSPLFKRSKKTFPL